MARRVVFVDDLDGSPIEDDKGGPVTLSLRGEYFEIDLSEKNQAKLEKALEPFITKATKVAAPSAMDGRPAKAATRTKLTSSVDLAAVRTWAKANGHEVSDRGRIAAPIMAAYEEAKGL